MGPKTKYMVILGQTIQQRLQLGNDTPSITDRWMSALNDDGYAEKDNKDNRMCSCCGNVKAANDKQDTYYCFVCGESIDRLINVARNIMKKAIKFTNNKK
jgi:predicted RNA-binding Zn-ribbon protein involved in translation (DUF1610 family)